MTPLPSPGIHWCEVMTVDWMGNGVLAFLAAVGIAALVWLVTGGLLRRRPPGRGSAAGAAAGAAI